VRVFTILDRLFGMALSTLHDWSSLRHQSQEDSQRPQIPVRETIPTKIYCKRANLRSSLFLMRRMLTPRRFQVFDFSVSRQLVGAVIRASGLAKEENARRVFHTCSIPPAETSLNCSRQIIDAARMTNPILLVAVDDSACDRSWYMQQESLAKALLTSIWVAKCLGR